MKRRILGLIPIALCFAVFILCRRQLDLERNPGGRLALDDAPTSLYGVFVFGAFKPFFLEQLWSQVERYEREGRFWELIDAQERLLRLTPGEPRVWFRQSWVLAYGVAQNEPDDELRWRWYRRVLAMLDAGIARHPDDFALAELRFRVQFDLIAGDSYCAGKVAPGVLGGGLLTATRLAAELRRDFPDRPAARDAYRRALEESAEYLMNRGRFRESGELITELRRDLFAEPWPFPSEPLRPGLREVLDFSLAAMTDLEEGVDWAPRPPVLLDEARLLGLLEHCGDLIEVGGPARIEPELETFDLAVVMLIHVRGMNLCQAALLAKNHASALRLIPPLNRIATLAEGRVDSEMPYYSRAYVEAMAKFIALDAELLEARKRGGEVAEVLEGRWRRELEELDRLIGSSAGRSDSFAKRLMDSRR